MSKINDGQDTSNTGGAGIPMDLTEAQQYIPRDDSSEIVSQLKASVAGQEMSRIIVTKSKMTVGLQSEIDRDQLMAYWRVLAHHYRGSKFQEIFERGVKQLQKLSPENSKIIVHMIRQSIESTLNREMEQKEINFGLNIPLIGKIGLGKLRLAARGPRISLRRLQMRLFRLVIEIVVGMSVLLGTLHWIAWTIFNEPYLAQTFTSTAKFVQLVLLLATTIIVWAITRDGGPQFDTVDKRKLTGTIFRFIGWSLVLGGWIHWWGWLLFDGASELVFLEPVLKMTLPFFLLSGCVLAWLLRRILVRSGNHEST